MGFFDFLKEVPFVGDVIGAGAGLLGDKFNRQGVAAQNQANRESGLLAARENAALQREFAQHGVRWKVRDAKAAGLHPLAALGMQPVSAQPVHVGSDDSAYTSNTLANFGQDINRSIHATMTQAERVQTQMDKLNIERAELQNEVLRTQLAGSKQALLRSAQNPPFPGSGAVVVKPSEVVTGDQGNPQRQPGTITSYQLVSPGPDGSVGIVPSEQMKERIEDDFIGETMWHLKNRLTGPGEVPGYYWSPWTQSFKPGKRPRPLGVK